MSARFWSRVAIGEPDDCWFWTGGRSKGYGIARIAGRNPQHAHRIAYELVRGRVPSGSHVHHKCETPLCVNPAHLEVLTQSDHMRLHHPAPEGCRRCGGGMERAARGTWVCRPCDRERKAADRAARTPEQVERDRAVDRERKRKFVDDRSSVR